MKIVQIIQLPLIITPERILKPNQVSSLQSAKVNLILKLNHQQSETFH